MNELINDLKNSIFNNSSDLIADYLEIGVDTQITNEIIKEVPIVKTLLAMFKIGKNIYDWNLLKNTEEFVQEFNRGEVDKEKIDKYKNELEKNSQKCEKEFGRVLLLLNKFIDKEKAFMLSRLFKAYVEEKINWKEFCEYSEIVDRLFINDLELLKKIKNQDVDIMKSREDVFRVERLYSLGLIGICWTKELTWQDVGEGHINSIRTINPLGEKFCDIVFIEDKKCFLKEEG
ncbi:MAG: hypothetical protein IJ220_01630 [Clostridia bacterium]|nr:hypothetical protein [Clostridia bacterium]